MDSHWTDVEPIPFIVSYRLAPLLHTLTDFLVLHEYACDTSESTFFLAIRMLRFFGTYDEARVHYLLKHHIFEAKILPETTFYLGILQS